VELYIVRHAEAHPLGEGGSTTDDDRSLTSNGTEQARKVGSWLHQRGARPDVVLTSPLVRARQTAEQLVAQWEDPPIELRPCDELAPGGKRRKLARVLNKLGRQRIVLVGHEPDLSTLVGWLIGSRKAKLALAKAGIALVECEEEAGKGGGTLAWLVTPQCRG
jgi:phosphohistidine phosphatase